MKPKGDKPGRRGQPGPNASPQPEGLDAAARVLAAGGRVPKKFARAAVAQATARPAAAGPTRGEAEAWAKISPARRVAFEILSRMTDAGTHSDDLLHSALTANLAEADRNLATALVMGVLRWQIALDLRIRRLLDRPDQRLAEPVAIALRLGALQLLHMDRIPAHAALSESVELCRAAGEPHAAGMVNAILRRLAAAPADRPPIFETPAALAGRLGHPAWLVERWVRLYGRAAAQAICEHDQKEPAPGQLLAADPALPAMDDGSRLVAELAAVVRPQASRVWDCCAAPGGKTTVLAARLPRASLLASDASPRRLAMTAARLRQVAPSVECLASDAAALPPERGDFDLILCDVPCSGTGTLSRNPEIRLRLQPDDLPRQASRQAEILRAAARRLAPGGRLVYSTCSLEPEENEAVLATVQTESPWLSRLPVEQFLSQVAALQVDPASLVRDGALRTLPGVHPADGFYAVVLERSV